MSSELLTAIIALLFGSGGLVSGYVMVRKLPSERTIAAVTASDKSVETMQRVNAALEADLEREREKCRQSATLTEYWHARCLARELAMTEHGIHIDMIPAPPKQAAQ